ncbi:MAG: hypothetical protein H9Q65_06270 [Spiroplasma ixodetis]|nr:hypothetical protein [Spiroplasma ixodetis]MBP1528827.1 hypothetical protein [Spiroplasma ixodetis]
MQDSKELIKDVQNVTKQKVKKINNFKKWIKTNYKKIILWTTVITALLLSIMSYYKTYNYKSFQDYDYTVYWGVGTTIWSHKTYDEHQINLYFGIQSHHQGDIKWDGTYPNGYFNK